ncbi:MAG: valine--tRNA ligase [Candidatus Firestonebacteria bacterium]
MKKELSKRYDPKDVEKKWYKIWLSKNYFHSDVDSKKPSFSLVIPPPNITGALHIGHALNNTLQDIIARFKRMQGFNVLWLPGVDHAGIATQNVIEKELVKEGQTRDSLGREKFVKKVWEWKEKYGNTIINQLQELGCSCDWSRTRFTMDEGLSNAVKEVFVQLYKEGLIYRDNYIINWCPRCKTALSDIEVEHKEIKGNFYFIKYPVKNKEDEHITVATTRPETMLGDTAVAINPNDKRWVGLIGKTLRLPIMDREIPVITDDKIDMTMGTGAVKVTPAHDADDFETGKTHKLPSINIMNSDATMNGNAGKYKGLDRYVARKEIVNELQKLGLLVKIEDHTHSVGHCYRCNTVIEPTFSLQWFIRIKPLAEPAIKAVKEGKIKFIPESWTATYYNWMENIKDWCISRQLWWGHRLPVWYCNSCDEINVANEKPEKCQKCGGDKLKQDPDVLDTWFSSALWPFSTLGWPDNTPELKVFYPTSILSTGFDIIFFWVARMIMMGLKFKNDVPFKEVYIHALIRDIEGKKMSKSKGNVLDPLVVIDKYGTDALRFTLGILAAQGRDIYLSEDRIEGYRNFANKIWNASRFVLMNLDGFNKGNIKIEKMKLTLRDRWIISKFNRLINETTNFLNTYNFDKAAQGIYEFLWHEFCDWYIEISKPSLNKDVYENLPQDGGHSPRETTQHILCDILERTLRLLHPFMPFITEEIWQYLPHEGDSIMVSSYPTYNKGEINEDVEKEMELIKNVIIAIRNIRSEVKTNPSNKVDVWIRSDEKEILKVIENNSNYITDLAKVSTLKAGAKLEKPNVCVTAVLPKLEIFVLLKEAVDLQKEREKLNKEIEKITKELISIKKKFANEEFLQKAPAKVIADEKLKQKELLDKKEKLVENLKRIENLVNGDKADNT